MTPQRVSAFLLLCVQAAAVGYSSETVVFPVAVCAAGAAGLLWSKRYTLSRGTAFRLTAGLAVLFLVKYRLAPHHYPYMVSFVGTPLAHVIAQYLLVIQAAQFFLARRDDRLPLAIPALAAVTMICAADVQLSEQSRPVFQMLAVGFAVMTALFFASSHKPAEQTASARPGAIEGNPRNGPMGGAPGATPVARVRQSGRLGRGLARSVTLLLAGLVAWGLASGLHQYERSIEDLIVRYLEPSDEVGGVGFGERVQLGSVARHKTSEEDQVALRVQAQRAPGYLRGKAFGTYDNDRNEWQVFGGSRILRPTDRFPAELAPDGRGESVFAVRDVLPADGRVLELWPDGVPVGRLPAPRGTTHVRLAAGRVQVNDHDVLVSGDVPGGFPYTVFVAGNDSLDAASLTREYRRRLTDVPEELKPEVNSLAQRLFADCSTTREKLAAVENYFHSHYEYRLGVSVPADVDPLAWFLREHPAAHCEFFAAGAAVLLRAAGVPCRYVTGFVVREQNPYGGYWVARNRDAHAWVEAYSQSTGWVLVDATPPSGVPDADSPSHARQAWEALQAYLQMLRIRLSQGGLGGFGAALLSTIAGLPGLIALAALLLLGLGWFWKHGRANRCSAPQEPLRLRRLRRMREQVDARLGKQHLYRHPGETLHQFSERIVSADLADGNPTAGEMRRTAARWYRLYASIRYRPDADEEMLEHLVRTMPSEPSPPKRG